MAQTFLSSLLVFALVNALLYPFRYLRASTAVDTPMTFYGVDRLLPAYPGWNAEDLIQLHEESRVTFAYEPIVEFRIKPIAGEYVNASAPGFRRNAQQGPWPPNSDAFNVFVFGGSTTFGWLLADRDTFVSQLQEQVATAGCDRPVRVYNFGQPSYISTQEALFFQSLVRAGTAPDVAVFVDGFNDFFFRGQMSFTSRLRGIMDGSDLQLRLGPITSLPMYQLARRMRATLRDAPPDMEPAAERQLWDGIIAQWLSNKTFIEAIGRQHGVRTAFVWQPMPAYKYDMNHHFLYRDTPDEPLPYTNIGRAYTLMSQKRSELEGQQNFLWLADMQEDRRENLYVDRIHYSAAFSRDIASQLLVFLQGANLLGCQS